MDLSFLYIYELKLAFFMCFSPVSNPIPFESLKKTHEFCVKSCVYKSLFDYYSCAKKYTFLYIKQLYNTTFSQDNQALTHKYYYIKKKHLLIKQHFVYDTTINIFRVSEKTEDTEVICKRLQCFRSILYNSANFTILAYNLPIERV